MRSALGAGCLVVALCGCGGSDLGAIEVAPTLEHRTVDGSLYTPATQSLLRRHSWLEEVEAVRVRTDADHLATFHFDASDHFLTIVDLPLAYLVPRLFYSPAQPPDAFDAFNLMLAEYSRNSVSVPHGRRGDRMARFETDLSGTVPWTLRGDYDFAPNRLYRPQRVGVINNCLKPGLWELNASDRSGEVYHSWFTLPEDYYYGLVSRLNDLPAAFTREALAWRDTTAPLDLERLRRVERSLGEVSVTVQDAPLSYSSQDSRRKIERAYALLEVGGQLHPPRSLGDLLQNPVAMSSFREPGIYSSLEEDRVTFDFGFLDAPRGAEVRLVQPRTHYGTDPPTAGSADSANAIEIIITLGHGEQLILGNLPLDLLVDKDDFVLHGFGVGILNASGLAERRAFLLEEGPPPSYAYLARRDGERLLGLNSHRRGLEQVFLRSHPDAAVPYWEVAITSYERIVDLVRYRVEMPEVLRKRQQRASRAYIPPIYFTYRDDNVS